MARFLGKDNLMVNSKVSKYIFFVALVLLLFVDYISATSILHPFIGRVFQVTILLLGIKILMTQYTKREWVILGIGGVLAVASYFCTDSYYVCLLIMLIMASKDMALRPIMLVYFTIVSGITLLVMVLAASGICGNMFLEQDFRLNGLEIRYCMGYTHPNSFHIVLIQLFLAGIWLFWNKMKWYYFVLLFGLNMLTFYFTDSRTNMILGSIMLVGFMILKFCPQLTDKLGIYILGGLTYAGCITISILAFFGGYAMPILNKIDQLWTNRMTYAYICRICSKLTLFSGEENKVRCDMGFINSMYSYGIVIVIMIIVLMLFYLITISKNRDYLRLVGFIVCVILFTGEMFASGEYITRNLLFVFMLGWGTYESNKPKEQNS